MNHWHNEPYLLIYKMSQDVLNLGWVDFDFCCSTVYLILLGLMRDRQNAQSSWAR